MKDFSLMNATIKAKVLESVYISEHRAAIHVLIKEVEYELINFNTCERKSGKIMLKDFSERAKFYVCDRQVNDLFASTAHQLVRGDVIVFSILNSPSNGYNVTSLKFDYDFYVGSDGVLALIERCNKD